MTIKEQIKILDNKIRQNQADYDLYRQNAKISALSSGKLNQYEYLTGEDLGYKPDTIQKAKFEYSPLGQVFNKGLDPNEEQEGLLKRLQNIEDKTDKQLRVIEDNKHNQLGIKSIGYNIRKKFSAKGLNTFKAIVNQEKSIDYKYLNMKTGSKKHFEFRVFTSLEPLVNAIYFGEILIPAIVREQDTFDYKIEELKKYQPRTKENVSDKNKVLINAQNVYDGREMIITAFKNKLFPLYSGNYYEESPLESEKSSEDEMTDNEIIEQITKLGKCYGPDLISNYFKENSLREVLNQLKNYRKKPGTFQKYNNLITYLIIRLRKVKKDTQNMSEDEIKIKD